MKTARRRIWSSWPKNCRRMEDAASTPPPGSDILSRIGFFLPVGGYGYAISSISSFGGRILFCGGVHA